MRRTRKGQDRVSGPTLHFDVRYVLCQMSEPLTDCHQDLEYDLPSSRDTWFPEYSETGAVVGSLRCERPLWLPMTSGPVRSWLGPPT